MNGLSTAPSTPTSRAGAYVPFLLSGGTLVLIILVCLWQTFERNQGFSHILDDAYIHLSMARNWAEHGVFGVTPYEASSTSSSLLWTALLALLIRIGMPFQEYLPLVLNMLAALGVLWLGNRQFQQVAIINPAPFQLNRRRWLLSVDGARTLFASFWLIFVVVATSFPLLVQYGMEHSLHALLAFLFLLQAGKVCSRTPTQVSKKEIGWLLLLSLLLGAVRYEGLFTVGWAALVLLAQRRWPLAIGIVGVAALVPLGFALYSVQQGWYPIPNSLVVKATLGDNSVTDILQKLAGRTAIQQLQVLHRVVVLSIMALFMGGVGAILWLRRQRVNQQEAQRLLIQLILVIGTLVLQLMFVLFVDRYYIYLYIIGLIFMGQVLWHYLAQLPRAVSLSRGVIGRSVALMAVVIALLYPFGAFGYHQFPREWVGASNIYEQHHQLARFLRTYYTGETVMANDIGVITYYADIRLVDIAGLGTIEMAHAKREGRFNSDFTEAFARERNVKIAMLYESWYVPGTPNGPPASWVRVGSWAIPDNLVAGSSRVTFFATSAEQADPLEAQLREFSPTLPPQVMVELPQD